ncbi:MAG: biotin synthase BioB [Pelagibacterales bacterium]|nr:biotin synthase BioB [Pelagibacterales bacterium]OUU61220.1 MAG: biotin synthase BioB [Alphaproteobacteria bacterium TMED62]|tara:strand:+ start:2782 stop:3762 length:981 start_codon:yes stop_codon:yes gene_type:complete
MKKTKDNIRSNWTFNEALKIYNQSFNELLYKAQSIHRNNFNNSKVQMSTLLSVKTGSCPEDCAYCPQSAHHNTNLEKEKLINITKVKEAAIKAKSSGSTRFCLGAAWRSPTDKDLDIVCEMIKEVSGLGMETCVTLGMLKDYQAKKLAEAGLDFYNHNIDTSEEYYSKIISTRNFDDRLNTLENVRKANLKVCCGGILGMGETVDDRIKMLITLANLPKHPESVPLNQLIKIPGTPLEKEKDLDPIELVKTIALARILMPYSYVRLSAGRTEMSESTQALAFLAGANSIFQGDILLTAENPGKMKDIKLFKKLGIVSEELSLDHNA